MLNEWLAPTAIDQFKDRHWQREPAARPGTARAAVSLLTWATLDRILSAAPDVLVVARGRHWEVPAPRDAAATRTLLQQGLGLVIRRAERQDTGLYMLARAFAKDLTGAAHVQLFVTASRTHGFGWHWDFEDVFIVQTYGVKDYYFRPNTVAQNVAVGTEPDFELFWHETSPLASTRLWPGDWLYLPARWWHMARCIDDSLSISIGVLPLSRTEADAEIQPYGLCDPTTSNRPRVFCTPSVQIVETPNCGPRRDGQTKPPRLGWLMTRRLAWKRQTDTSKFFLGGTMKVVRMIAIGAVLSAISIYNSAHAQTGTGSGTGGTTGSGSNQQGVGSSSDAPGGRGTSGAASDPRKAGSERDTGDAAGDAPAHGNRPDATGNRPEGPGGMKGSHGSQPSSDDPRGGRGGVNDTTP